MRRYLWLALTLLALVLRAWDLGGPSLSVDEGVTAYYLALARARADLDSTPAFLHIPTILSLSGEVHPPGYFMLLTAWSALGGDEAWLRLSSVLLGTLCVPLTLWLGRLLGQEKTAPLGALLLATNPYHIQYSRELRMYPLLGVLILVALGCYVQWTRSRRPGWLAGYAGAGAAALYTHYFGGFALLLAGLYTLLQSRSAWKGWLWGTAGAVLALLPWLQAMARQATAQDLLLRSRPVPLDLLDLLGRMQMGDFLPEHAPAYVALGAFLVLPLVLWARSALLALWLLVPPLLAMAVSQTPLRIFEYKYFNWCSPFLALLEGRALGPWRLAVAALVMGQLAGWSVALFDPLAQTQDWRGAAALLRHAPEGALILVHPSMMAAPLLYYGIPPERMRPVDVMPSQEMARLVRSHPEVWLVSTPYHPLVARLGLEPFLDRLLVRQDSTDFPRRLPASVVRVVRYRPKGEGSEGAKPAHLSEECPLRVIIGSDHGGLALKNELVPFLKSQGFEVADYGVHHPEPVDYPDVALLVAHAVATDPAGAVGIIIDGAGAGSAITANKVPGIRAAACYDTFTARNSREHNDANVLTLGGRVTGVELAKEICRTWLASSFAGQRHARRVEKVLQIERRFLKEPV